MFASNDNQIPNSGPRVSRASRRAKATVQHALALAIPTLFSALVFHPAIASALSLSGVVIYSSDADGNPSGGGELFGAAYVWHTVPDRTWYGLGVWQGFLPQSLQTTPLNAPDFQLHQVLVDGSNEFTIVGEQPFVDFGADWPPNYVLDLYFDGNTEAPGLSVMFSGNAACSGGVAAANPGPVFSLALEASSTRVGAVYDNSGTRTSVEAVSFGPPTHCSIDVDLVSAFGLIPDGEPDYIGALKLLVEPVVPSPGPTPTVAPCAGDCNGDAAVAINELLTCVNIALGTLAPDACAACEPYRDTEVTITSILRAINNALFGCAAM